MRRAVLAGVLVACSGGTAVVDGGVDATTDVVEEKIGTPLDAAKDVVDAAAPDVTDAKPVDAPMDVVSDVVDAGLVCPWPDWEYNNACVGACSLVSNMCPDGGAGKNVVCSDCAPGDAGGCTVPNWGSPGDDASACALYATNPSPKPGGSYYWCCAP